MNRKLSEKFRLEWVYNRAVLTQLLNVFIRGVESELRGWLPLVRVGKNISNYDTLARFFKEQKRCEML